MEMNEERAREILGNWIRGGDILGGMAISYNPKFKGTTVELDGPFTAVQLEAIAWWMRHKGAK